MSAYQVLFIESSLLINLSMVDQIHVDRLILATNLQHAAAPLQSLVGFQGQDVRTAAIQTQ